MVPHSQRTSSDLLSFIQRMPKAELHLHIEGSLEPELIFRMAARNGIALPYESVNALRQAYQFTDLQSFLDLYYAGAGVLITEEDFYDMTMAYLRRAREDGVVHAEIMFDPQTHTARGVPIETVFAGIARAMRETHYATGMTGYLILSFLRHLSEDDAWKTLNAALPLREHYRDLWVAIGLDSGERGNPPEKFEKIYEKCRELGFRLTAHAGEEGPAAYVSNALDRLHVERIDHGVRSDEDDALIARLVNTQIPLTVCPLSNLKLKVVNDLQQHNLARMLRQGLRVTVNSDDPAYFGGYIADNYLHSALALGLSRQELVELARNSFLGSFLPDAQKDLWLGKLDALAG